jgi:hypothetical protein
MEFQARLSDSKKALDLPIEEISAVRALLQAYRAQSFIRERYRPLIVLSIAEVLRHDKDFIEHQIIWDKTSGFTK